MVELAARHMMTLQFLVSKQFMGLNWRPNHGNARQMESYSSDPVHQTKWQLPLLAMSILFLCVRLRAVSLAPHGISYEPTGTPHLKAVVFTTWHRHVPHKTPGRKNEHTPACQDGAS